jgi:DNA-binding GntR family transcriptional regulator
VARFSLAEIREGTFLPKVLELVTVEKVTQTITDDRVGQLRRNLSLQKTRWKSTISMTFTKPTPPCMRLFCLLAAILGPRPWPIPLGSIVEHHAIFAAIGTRNLVAARAATRLHLGQLVGFLKPLALARPDLFEPD